MLLAVAVAEEAEDVDDEGDEGSFEEEEERDDGGGGRRVDWGQSQSGEGWSEEQSVPRLDRPW